MSGKVGQPKREIPAAELRRLYLDEGMSSKEIAAIFGCNSQTIINRLKEYGIPIRSKAQAGLLKKGIDIPCAELRERR